MIAGWMLRILLLGLACVPAWAAPPPDWVVSLKDHPRLGAASPRDVRLLNALDVKFQPEKPCTRFHQRMAFLVGGNHPFNPFKYQETYAAGHRLEPQGWWRVTPEGKVERLSGDGVRASHTFGGDQLYADDMVMTWAATDCPNGAIVALEFTLTSNDFMGSGKVFLQDVWETDSTTATFRVAPPGVVQFVPRSGAEGAVRLESGGFQAGHFPEFKDLDYGGGFAVAAPRVDYFCFPSGDLSIPPQTWTEVAAEAARLWDKTGRDFQPPAVTELEAFLARFETEYRYVAVEIGAGRFIPHRPQDIFRLKYGDCKDLSWMLVRTLQAGGWEAFPVLVLTPAWHPFPQAYPSPYAFNHCILALRRESDTLYYDPTARGFGLGTLPWNLHGACALPVCPGAGLIRLPRDDDPLRLRRELDGELAADGSVSGRIRWTFEARMGRIFETVTTREEMTATLRRALRPEVHFTLHDFQIRAAEAVMEAHVTLEGLGSRRGAALYLAPFPFAPDLGDSVGVGSPDGYFLPRPARWETSVSLALPAGLSPEKAWADSLLLEAGESCCRTDSASGRLNAFWTHCLRDSHYPPARKTELDSLFQAVRKHQRMKLKLASGG
ncbi:MAG: hypothetical protein C4524_04835 [Candidatus Zixiibacteriota bacterium]|nr:MAG: hypothetical protein C4524_04835 [candidate division Zixibacteria bacterium]